MTQVDSLSVNRSVSINEGIAENKDALMNASKNCARQKRRRSVYRLALESRTTVTATSVSVMERRTSVLCLETGEVSEG